MYSSYSSSTATDMDYQKHSADPPQLRSGNPPVQTPPGTEAPWSTGLFSCFDDVPNCWKGNSERQNYGITMAPVVEGGMAK
ncbi:hypothetical protein RHGRI_026661 [Rhododendron griersonianum]|uniref:Uncharacterized protein n=1 Tax=Rhododendron griersonianum TaxID=479676 RepID=A0AAV6ITI9_9ERIC|nr:hypothetical protein RHGRI_026661 [Rhododendron griersonianum]KAG5532123.1 hypothetical protein RHGRI_026661 [Rhododendron griersonianum]